MPIYQINVWVCEVCGSAHSTTEETSPYSDPVVAHPCGKEWGYITDKNKIEFLACPTCLNKQAPTPVASETTMGTKNLEAELNHTNTDSRPETISFWAEKHGSQRLQRLLKLGYHGINLYRKERITAILADIKISMPITAIEVHSRPVRGDGSDKPFSYSIADSPSDAYMDLQTFLRRKLPLFQAKIVIVSSFWAENRIDTEALRVIFPDNMWLGNVLFTLP